MSQTIAESSQAPPEGFTAKWCHPAGETKYGEIILEPDGRLLMSGELADWSPGTWTIDHKAKELQLKIPWSADWKASAFEFYVEKGRIKRFDMDERTLTFDISKTPEYLSVFGLNHFPCK